MTNNKRGCRLAMEIPGRLALMTPGDLECHVRAHWAEWEGKWRPIDGSAASGEIFQISAGEPIYVIEQRGRHYLITEGNRIVFRAAA
jgi:hypothetical protein